MLLNEIALKNFDTKLEYHDELNPKLWDKGTLKPDVREALRNIANSLLVALKAPNDAVKDIVITGSNANYNWSKLSDIDLHIQLDYDTICQECKDNPNFSLDDCLKAKMEVWNKEHNVKIKGQDVEAYVQPQDEQFSGNAGIYSLINDQWIREPKKEENLVYDDKQIKQKAKKLMDEIDSFVKEGSDDKDAADKLKAKIKKMRQASIAKGGEFSLENLVFKTLRNNGYLDKLRDFRYKMRDNNLSLK
jgi:hypothetical protein